VFIIFEAAEAQIKIAMCIKPNRLKIANLTKSRFSKSMMYALYDVISVQVPEFRQDKVCEEGEEEEDVRDCAADGVGQRVEDV